MPKMILNSLIYVGGIVLLSVTIPAISGYITAKYDFKIKKLITSIVIITLVVPTIGSVTMTYRLMESLHLLNTFQGVFLMSAGGFGFSFLLFRNFFSAIPWEYAEAAFIDGAGHYRVFFQIMIPMAVPAMGALALLSGIGAWNSYQDVLLYNPSWPTLASGLYGISQTLPRFGNTPAYYAGLVIALIPILIIFCIFSDRIMRNFSVGGLKA